MTDILCQWLNDEVHLEPKLTSGGFAEQSSNGYLFGEVLHRHGLQNDFHQFSSGRSSEAKLNNFMRLEPTFRLLEIPFNINMARDIMTEKPGVATRLMYQLFVALNRKKQRQLTGQSLECMRPAGKVKLERIETGIFQEQLKHHTPRQVDLNFEALISKFHEKQRQHEEFIAREKKDQEKRLQEERKEACQRALEKSCQVREKQTQMYAKLKPIVTSKSSGSLRRSVSPRSSQTTAEEQLATTRRANTRSKLIAAETRANIDAFEATMKDSVTVEPGSDEMQFSSKLTSEEENDNSSPTTKIMVKAGETEDYVSQIKRRVQVNWTERQEREKRRRKVLMDHMRAMHQQEEDRREKMLVERLMRQCQQERRIATQLMHIRREKDTIRNNRIFRQKQQEEMRLKEFQEALDREAQIARQEESEKQERLKFHKELYQQKLAEKAKLNYAKNYELCHQVMLQLVDFATKMAHYRDLTQGMVPAKIVRDWKLLFIAGHPLYETDGDMSDAKSSGVSQSSSYGYGQKVCQDNQQLLDDSDFQEYKHCLDEWTPPENLVDKFPLPPNPILSHAVYRLLDMVDPPKPPPTPPKLPKSLLRASFIGKPFTGKSTTLQRLQAEHGIVVLSVEGVLTKAVDTFFAEKKRYERKESCNEDTPEDAPAISVNDDGNGKEKSQLPVPTITVEPSSSVDMNMSTPGTGVSPPPSQIREEEHNQTRTQKPESTAQQCEITEEELECLSPLAKLGYKAHLAMSGGESLDDETAVEIFVEEIKQLPEGNCLVMDNFPVSLEQAKLLASALTGQAKPQPVIPREFALLAVRETRIDEISHSGCGLDIVLHFTATTDTVLQRASQLASTLPQASNKLEQIQHRLMSFDELWPPLRRWYLRFRNLSTVNSSFDVEKVYDTARDKIQEVINKSKQAEAMKRLGLQGDGLSCDIGSTSNLALFALPTTYSESLTPSPTRKPMRRRRPSSAESPIKYLQQLNSPKKKGGKSSKVSDKAAAIFAPVNLNAEPGSSDWVYCDLPLSVELASGLAGKWPAVEETYISTLKAVFQHLRAERDCICQYFHDRRREFAEYLCRPDHKQEFVSQWQSSYNSLEPHLRQEDAMKAELHHRVDDLCDKLWDITDTRRDQAEQERQCIASDQWLEDHIGLLTNHFISVMQAELDRFYDTFMLLKDYYTGMEARVPSKLPGPGRLPLIMLTPTEAQEVPGSAASSTHSIANADSAQEVDTKKEPSTDVKSPPKQRVPLLPRQPPPEPTEDKGGKKKAGGGGSVLSPQPPVEDLSNLELDQQLVVHAYNSAVSAVFHMVTGELKGLEAAISEFSKPPSAQPQGEQDKPPAEAGREEKTAKGKKGKTPAPDKKGKASPAKAKAAPPTEAPPIEPTVAKETPEQLAHRQRMCQLYKEHKAAIEREECRIKLQLVLIKEKALSKISEFKAKDQATNEEMERWIGECYKQEVELSVSTLSDALRQAIENEEKLVNEVVLPGAKLEIRESVLMLELSPPPSPVLEVESEHPDHFTIDQLLALHQQLKTTAPSGFILARDLIGTLMRLANQTLGGGILPDNWKNITRKQVEELCWYLYGIDSDYVDWRQFIVCVAQPWPLPSAQDLLDASQQFSSISGTSSDIVNQRLLLNREKFMAVDIWLSRHQPQEAGQQDDLSRSVKLQEAFFDIFSDASTGLIDCHSLLLYLSADPQPEVGLCKALSVAVGRAPLTSLSPENVDPNSTILLKDFHKVLTHGVHPNSEVERGLSMSDLLEVFVSVSPENPNEVSLTSLLSNQTSLAYLTSANNYSLPVFMVIFQPRNQNETD